MRNINIKYILTIIFITTLIYSCSESDDKNNVEETSNINLIEISEEQFKKENMTLGNSELYSFVKKTKTNGFVSSSPTSKASIYTSISGIIKSIYVNPNSRVSKGQKLFKIESKEFISLQQEYLESQAKLNSIKSDYSRIKKLYEEKITSQKEFIKIESEYNLLNAKIQGLKAGLKILNIDFTNLESGNISSYVYIYSPISGFVTSIDCNIGRFIDSQSLLMEIIDNKNLQLHFSVYQENINNIKIGQKIEIYSPDKINDKIETKIKSIGKSVNPETKSIECIAELNQDSNHKFIEGMFFQVEIATDSLKANALANQAIIKTGNNHYIFVKEKQENSNMFFKRIKVNIGQKSEKFTQLIEDKNFKDVLINGTYYYQSEE